MVVCTTLFCSGAKTFSREIKILIRDGKFNWAKLNFHAVVTNVRKISLKLSTGHINSCCLNNFQSSVESLWLGTPTFGQNLGCLGKRPKRIA